MIIGYIVKAGVIATAALSGSVARNIWQTYQLLRQEPQSKQLLPKSIIKVDDALTRLKSMKRKELVQLYMSSDAPDRLSSISGPWNGTLLDNNGWIMTSVSEIITYYFFGIGDRHWNGKSFADDHTGWNQFQTKGGKIELEHKVDVSIGPSGLGKNSAIVRYSSYQSFFSPWRTMVDELRVLKLDYVDGEILICMGFMGWSGGVLNASPFCLHRKKDTNMSEEQK
mmetsp:Transcript_17089/g.25886  ORF Transcript_17089/g.25886 Transcript_17089/m.25886 type:complete len:225 (-) Transcript_17089:290-964(-)|eukprot:CAMPEP_0178917722 /NCGR_PEP_ID=MMETSP0786-20121207/13411_1 /TAXON_ID=186022 /ORGANISM="Thalassionema frauenfeldii, Strain CCMP 1798" /LENGTH=224 /DNA_ID=CAMNT_0020591317 /DNA_START=137 /DNA_END=811 /DNA_ORIENTATION=+